MKDFSTVLQKLPPNYFHLGDKNFAVVSCFKGVTRVHIRRYTTDENGDIKPTKDGVSISPEVWDSLVQRMTDVWCNSDADLLIIKRDLCVNKLCVGDKRVVTFQRMFARKNMCLEFVPQRVVLSMEQFSTLCSSTSLISKTVKDVFLQENLKILVLNELENYTVLPEPDSMGDPDLPDGWYEVRDSLNLCVNDYLTENINKMFKCSGCEDQLRGEENHECVNETQDSKFDQFHELAFDQIDWKNLTVEFVKRNHHFHYFVPLIKYYDFFECLSFDDCMNECKKLFAREKPNFVPYWCTM